MNDQKYTGFIKNISEGGIEYFVTTSVHISKKFSPQKNMGLHFQTESGESIHLRCEIRWFLRPLHHKDILTIGVKVIDPPIEYKGFLKTLKGSL
jgi:hypothetical protein